MSRNPNRSDHRTTGPSSRRSSGAGSGLGTQRSAPNRIGRAKKREDSDDLLKRLAQGGRPPRATGALSRSGTATQGGSGSNNSNFVGLIGLLSIVTIIFLLPFFFPQNAIQVTGIEPGESITPKDLALRKVRIQIEPAEELARTSVSVDGKIVPVSSRSGGSVIARIPRLANGTHQIRVISGNGVLWRSRAQKTVSFTVDSKSPALSVVRSKEPVRLDSPVGVSGKADPEAIVTVDGKEVVTNDGKFGFRYAYPPIGEIRVIARDRAGNHSLRRLRPTLVYPEIRAVRFTAKAWTSAQRRKDLFELIDENKINSVILDLKSDDGVIPYNSNVRQASAIGAVQATYDLRAAVAELHGRGIRVIGRLATFRDPVLAKALWADGKKNAVVLDRQGRPYTVKKAMYPNPLSRDVQNYNLELIKEASNAGVDDVLLDFVRRPEGLLSQMTIDGLPTDERTAALDKGLSGFLRRVDLELRNTRTRLGVTVFGTAILRPSEVGQNVTEMAKRVDYIVPLVYPSYWANRSYGVKVPAKDPGEIVRRAVEDFQKKLEGSPVAIIPFLQDFSLHVAYGSDDVRAQIDAAKGLGIDRFMLWDPKATYSADALTPDAPQLRPKLAGAAPKSAPVAGATPTEPAN